MMKLQMEFGEWITHFIAQDDTLKLFSYITILPFSYENERQLVVFITWKPIGSVQAYARKEKYKQWRFLKNHVS